MRRGEDDRTDAESVSATTAVGTVSAIGIAALLGDGSTREATGGGLELDGNCAFTAGQRANNGGWK